MAKNLYIGVEGKARKAKKIYVGIGGTAREVKKAYIGVNGVARLFYSGGKNLSSIENGQFVYFRENGVYQKYVVVRNLTGREYLRTYTCNVSEYSGYSMTEQAYDSSCHGVWIMKCESDMKVKIAMRMDWADGSVQSYLNSTYTSKLDDLSLCKDVKLPRMSQPYKAFCLSTAEIGAYFGRDDKDEEIDIASGCGFASGIFTGSGNDSGYGGYCYGAKWINTNCINKTDADIHLRPGFVQDSSIKFNAALGESDINAVLWPRGTHYACLLPCVVLPPETLVNDKNQILSVSEQPTTLFNNAV